MNGPFGNGFPYTNFHELNMNWIIRIAKDFLDQYTHIQDIISSGETSLQETTAAGLESLQAEKTRLEGLLDAWYTEHSDDIAGQLTQAISDFQTAAAAIGDAVIATIPEDYTDLSNEVDDLKDVIPVNNSGSAIFRNASIGSDGTITEGTTTRLLTAMFTAKTGDTFDISSDYDFRVAFYDNSSFVTMTSWVRTYTFTAIDTSTYDSYRINARNRLDSSADVAPDDVTFTTDVSDLIVYKDTAAQDDLESVQNANTALKNTIKDITSGRTLCIEQGSISAVNGAVADSDIRIRTGYLKFSSYPVTISTESGYELKPFIYDEDFSFNSAPGDWRTSYTINGDDYYRRFVIRKSNGTPITPSEFASAISSGLTNAYCVIPSDKLQNEIYEINNKYGLELSQFNLNRNMVGNGDMIWEYQNWTAPLAISHNGINNRLFFTYTSDMGYSGIAQYDFDTKQLTKNVLKQNVEGATDDHDLIGVIMLPSYKILCAYSGGHNTDRNMYIRISSARESIETFDDVITLMCSDYTTYAQIFYYDSKLYLFYRLNNTKWAYRIGTNGGTTWSDETIFIADPGTDQIYCQISETTTAGVLRVCCYTNPAASDTAIRMGFLHLDDMKLYDTDNETVIGTTNISRTDITIIIQVPSSGKVNRLFSAAKTAITKTLVLYSVFTIEGEGEGTDGEYRIPSGSDRSGRRQR